MEGFKTNDGIHIAYDDVGHKEAPLLILIHGFTGSSKVFVKNTPVLAQHFRVIVPDLRGHGESDKPRSGFHVSRLAMDLKNLIEHLRLPAGTRVRAIGGSLGCAILWSYAELFTTVPFSHMVFVDQAPLQNYTYDSSWGPAFGNRSMNSATSVVRLQTMLDYDPQAVYAATIDGCLGYRSHPLPTDKVTLQSYHADTEFFMNIAKQGNPQWYGLLMADHTALDWRGAIKHCFGPGSGSDTRVLVVASSRSGCFPAEGLMAVTLLCNEREDGTPVADVEKVAAGVVVDFGGHWCYWEDPDKFNRLVLDFLL